MPINRTGTAIDTQSIKLRVVSMVFSIIKFMMIHRRILITITHWTEKQIEQHTIPRKMK
ncbi:MAG: hypothetical protein V3U58_04700 [Thermodesulfobacteriota bacterium]